jgi:hypothetical protein
VSGPDPGLNFNLRHRMQTSSTQTPESPPYRRWFCYLAVASILALVSPYFANKEDRFHSPHVAIYSEANGKREPMTQKVWFDGRFYAQYETRPQWLVWGLIFVGIEAVGYGIYRLRARRKTSGCQSTGKDW